MSWIGAVGHWVGNDGSALVSGVLGAGAALAGGLVGRRRAERREDTAAWRDRRLDLFSAVLDTVSEAQGVGMELIVRLRYAEVSREVVYPGPPFTDQVAEFLQHLSAMHAQRRRLRLMTEKATFETFEELRAEMSGFYDLLPHDLSPSYILLPEVDARFREIQSSTNKIGKRLESLMLRQLGLPED